MSRTVIVLHGLARTHRSVAKLRRAIAGAGFQTWSATYPSMRMGIRALAEHTAARVQKEAPGGPYFAVTHSLGGILVRHMHGLIPLERVVMLAPPNQGSRLASALSGHPLYRWLYGPAGQDVTDPSSWPPPPSPFLVIAGTKGATLGNPISWVTRAAKFFPPDTPSDGTLSVEETRHPDMTAFATVDAAHTFIMNHPEAQRLTLEFLTKGK
ncbi:MAG: alpha/beta fold hydrolase [Myxococcota bacterium]